MTQKELAMLLAINLQKRVIKRMREIILTSDAVDAGGILIDRACTEVCIRALKNKGNISSLRYVEILKRKLDGVKQRRKPGRTTRRRSNV